MKCTLNANEELLRVRETLSLDLDASRSSNWPTLAGEEACKRNYAKIVKKSFQKQQEKRIYYRRRGL